MSDYKTTNFDKVECSELKVAGTDVTAAMEELGTLNGLTASKDELNILDGVTANKDEINLLDGIPTAFVLTPAAGGANVCEVTIDSNVTRPVPLLVWLSDSATGEGLTGTAASGTVQAKAANGTVLGALTAKKCLVVQTKADGNFVLEITDTAKTAFVVCVSTLMGELLTQVTLETADYGA